MRRQAKLLCLLSVFLLSTALSGTVSAQQKAREGGPSVKEVTLAADAFSRGDALPAWVKDVAVPTTKFKQSAVTRLADTQFRVDTTSHVFVHRAIQVNDSSALGQIGQFQINFVPEYQRVHLHSVRILRGDQAIDHTKTVDVRFLEREAGLENGTYSGTVTASLLLSDVRIGDTLQIKYSTDGANPVFNNQFADWSGWDQLTPTESRSVILSYPVSRAIQWQVIGDLRPFNVKPETREVNGFRYLEWKDRGLDVADYEPYIPEDYFPFRLLQFSEFKDWNAVARWANTLFPEVKTLPPELTKVIDDIRQLPDPTARAAAALRWVQEDIRYFSVSLGESSHRPHTPAEVLKQRFGDCKDKSYLLVTMLRQLGIEAQPMLVSLSSPRATAKLLPMPTAFDHAIVHARINGQDYYLDGTRLGQRGKLDKLGPSLEGAYGLIVSADTQALKVISNPNIREVSTIEQNEDIALAKFGDAGTLQSRMIWRGNYAEAIRLALAQMTPEQLRKYALSNYELRYTDIALVGEPTVKDDQENNEVTLSASFSIPKLATPIGSDWAIRFAPSLMQRIANIPQQTKRTYPMTGIAYPYSARYNLNIEWPESVAMVTDPSTRRLNSDFFNLEIASSFRGNHSKYSLSFDARDVVVEPSKVSKYVDDVHQIDRYIGSYVGVGRDSIKQDGVLGIGKTTLLDTMTQREKKRIEQLGKAIDSGKLSGDDLAEAYCDRAEAQSDIGSPQVGMKDAETAVKLAPDLARAAECRANLYATTGEHIKAIADYSKAIRNGAASFGTYYGRGRARFYANKLVEATDDFAKASRMTDDGGDRLYADLWYVWTMQKLGKPLADDIVKRAEENPLGAWPRPALAMLVGKLTPEQMLAEVNKKTGDERELNMVEANFYLGQYYLLKGQAALAKAAFEQTRSTGITMYVEHVSAGFELDRMKAK